MLPAWKILARNLVLLGSITLLLNMSAQQNPHKVLVNADIVKMAQAGLADETITATIEGRSTKFDTSPDALISLTQAKVSQIVIQAMIRANSPKSPARTASGASETAPGRLGEGFSVIALRALSSIRGEQGQPGVSNGGITVPRHTQEMIDEADSTAQSSSERAVVAALNRFYLMRLSDNMSRELFKLKQPFYGDTATIRASEAMEHDPEMQKLAKNEDACATPIENALRARQATAIPKACLSDIPGAPTSSASEAPMKAGETKALAAKAIEKLGGKEKLASIHGYREILTNGSEVLVVYPDKVQLTVPKGASRQVITMTADQAYSVLGKQKTPLPEVVRDEGRRLSMMDIYSLASAIETGAASVSDSATDETVDGKPVRALVISRGPDIVRWLVDPDSGSILQTERPGFLQNGQAGMVKYRLSDWRDVEGILVPYRSVKTGSDGSSYTNDLASIQFNPPDSI